MANKNRTFDEVLSVGFSVQDISDIVAESMKKAQANAKIKLGIDGSSLISSFLEEMKKLQSLQDKVKLEDPFQWDAKKLLDEMKKVAKELDNALNLEATPETDKLIETLSNKLATLNTRFEDLGGEIPKSVGKGAAAIKLLKEQLEGLENVPGLKDSDLSILVDKSSVDALEKQMNLVKGMFKELQETTGIDFGSFFGLETKEYKAQLDEAIKKNEQLSKQVDELKAKMSGMSDVISGGKMPKEWQDGLNGQLKDLGDQLKNAEAELKAYQDYIGDLGEKGVDTEEYDKAIKKQEELQKKVNELTQSLQQQAAQIQTYNERAESLVPKSDLEKKIDEVKKLEKEIETLREKSSMLDDILLGRLSKVKVNNVDPATVVKDINGLLDKYDQDNQEYHYDKAAKLYGQSGTQERIIRNNKDITDDLIARYNKLIDLQRNAQNIATELGQLNKEIFEKNRELEKEKEKLRILQEEKKLLEEAEQAARAEAQAEKEKADALEKENTQLKENVELQKKQREEAEKATAAAKASEEAAKKAAQAQAAQPTQSKATGKAPTATKQVTPQQTSPTTPIPTQGQQRTQPQSSASGQTVGQIKNEIGAFVNLKTAITNVNTAAEEKNATLEKESGIVKTAVDSEIADFDRLVGKINEVIDTAKNKAEEISHGEPIEVDIKPSDESIKDFMNKVRTGLDSGYAEGQNEIQMENKESVESFSKLRSAIVDYLGELENLNRLSNNGVIPNLNQRRVTKNDAIAASESYKGSGFVDTESENILVRYVSRLKDVDKALQSLGITNDDVVKRIKDKLQSALNVQEQYSGSVKEVTNSQMELSNVLKNNYLQNVNKNDINTFLKSVTSDTSIKDFAEQVRQTFGVIIPTSVNEAARAFSVFDSATDQATSGQSFNEKTKVDINVVPKVDEATFAAGVNSQVATATSGDVIKPVLVPVDVKGIDDASFIGNINAKVNEFKSNNNESLSTVDVPISIGDGTVDSVVTNNINSLQKLIDFIHNDVVKAIGEISSAFSGKSGSATTAINSDINALKKLVEYIDKTVIKAIRNKTEEFRKEADSVAKYTAREKTDIGKLVTSLKSVELEIKTLSKTLEKTHINIDSSGLTDLDNALEKLQGKTVPDFSNLKELNEALKMTKGRSAKFDEYATDIASGLDKIIGAFSKGNYSQQIDSFLKQIQRLSDSSSQFKEMVTALNNLDKVGKATSGAAIKDFDKATSDYITAYNTNSKRGTAESASMLAVANQRLTDTYKALNDAVNQGLLTGEEVNRMYVNRFRLISSSTSAIDTERKETEKITLATQMYLDTVEKLYNAKIKQLNNPDTDLSMDIGKLQSDADSAFEILEDLRNQKKITDEVFNDTKSKGEAFDTKYADKAEALVTKKIQKIDSTLANMGFEKAISKFESEFGIFGTLTDDVKDKLNQLRANITVMADTTANDLDRIKAHADFTSIRQELSDLLRQTKEQNPFEELSPKNTGFNYKEYVDAFTALRTKAEELNRALSNKEPQAVIDGLRNEIYVLKDGLDDAAKSGKDFLDAQKRVNDAQKDFENSGASKQFVEVYNKANKELEELNQKLDNGKITQEEYIQTAKQITNEYERTQRYMDGSIVGTGIMSSADAMNQFKASLQGVGTLTKDITGSIVDNNNQVSRWTATYREADGTIKQVTATYDSLTHTMSQNTVIVGKELVGLAGTIDLLKKKYKELMVYWTSNMLTPFNLIRYAREGIQVIQQYDDAMVEMRKVSNDTEASLQSFAKASFDIANSVGTTGLQMQQSAADFLRLGNI